jgi:hypothetical protein
LSLGTRDPRLLYHAGMAAAATARAAEALDLLARAETGASVLSPLQRDRLASAIADLRESDR